MIELEEIEVVVLGGVERILASEVSRIRRIFRLEPADA